MRGYRRRKGHEQGMVAQLLRHLVLIVFFVLLEAEDLSGAGLAGDAEGCVDTYGARGAVRAVDHLRHRARMLSQFSA
jgi:hypothetical protein